MDEPTPISPKPLPKPSRLRMMARQLKRQSPFEGDCQPSRVRLFHPGSGRPALPFPHPWNYLEPIRILETYFHGTEKLEGDPAHNRYLEVPGFHPVLVSRDPGFIRAILKATGDKPGQFDRDTMPSRGIARATGEDTLLFANGPAWRLQKKLSALPFSRSSLFQPERFSEFENTFRQTVQTRIAALKEALERSGQDHIRIPLETEIKVVMLEMLVNNFFGAEVPTEEIRTRFVPALERVIDHIVTDTVVNRIGIPVQKLPNFLPGVARAKADLADFEALTDIALAPRKLKRGLWSQFESEHTDDQLRSNIRVFLAGALEATTSFASWALHHLAHAPEAQEALHREVAELDVYEPAQLRTCKTLHHVLEETLRLTPSLYFLPRRATADTWVEAADGRRLHIPNGTHILLDVWHANRREDVWGESVTGHAAAGFAPDRWRVLEESGVQMREFLHFGFGHGARVCPGKFLGLLEVSLVVGAAVKMFKFQAADTNLAARAGVSTKPREGVLVDLSLRGRLDNRLDRSDSD